MPRDSKNVSPLRLEAGGFVPPVCPLFGREDTVGLSRQPSELGQQDTTVWS